VSYLLDANVFIQAKNFHYGFDFCPAFWDWLIASNHGGLVYSIEKVGDELEAGSDELATWAAQRGSAFFIEPNAATLPALGRVSSWASASGQAYEPGAINTFLQVADYYLIAQALTRGDIVVSHEIASNTKKRVKIPDVCLGLGIKCVTPFEMLRTERARFVLSQ
jgi:hypothetical protein